MPKATTSKRGNQLNYSSIRKLLPFAAEAKAQGVEVIRLNIGDPDLQTPAVFLNRLHNWDMDPIRYAQPAGEAELIAALYDYYQKCGYNYVAKEDIIVTIGGSEALAMAMFAIADNDDEVLVPEPFFANYSILAQMQDIKLIPIPTSINDGFRLPKKADIAKLITKRTKGILYSSPGNPTGTTYTKEEVEMLIDLCVEHGIHLISDEVYREFIFSDQKHVSLATYMDKYPHNLIMLDSFSKRYNLCGARLGMLVSKDEKLKDVVLRMANGRLSGVLIDQIMGAALKDVPNEHFEKVSKELKGRRDVVFAALKKIKGVSTYLPEGAFYLMVGLPVEDAEDFCKYLLQEFRLDNTTLMLAPGKGFYLNPDKGQNEVRIAYVVNKQALSIAMKILESALKAYMSTKR